MKVELSNISKISITNISFRRCWSSPELSGSWLIEISVIDIVSIKFYCVSLSLSDSHDRLNAFTETFNVFLHVNILQLDTKWTLKISKRSLWLYDTKTPKQVNHFVYNLKHNFSDLRALTVIASKSY